MNENCKKWREQLKHLREKHAEFMQTYAEALEFAAQNPKIRETSFTECRKLFNEIKPLVMELREDFPRLTKEQLAELAMLKTRFDELPELHEGIKWEDVEKALMASPDAINKLMALDEKGHQMNVFRAKNDGEIQFRSAQTDIAKIAEEHRKIMYDQKAQTDRPKNNANGNAVDIAASMGVELADKELYEQLRVVNGWVWLETPADIRKSGLAFRGLNSGIDGNFAYFLNAGGSFCAALRVKKA